RLPQKRDARADDLVTVAGALELRHGRFDSLARGATLMGVSEGDLVADFELGTEAGARVVGELARAHGIIEAGRYDAWSDVIEALSGPLYPHDRVDYRARVLSLLHHGGAARARDGEVIVIDAHPDVPLALTFAPPLPQPLGTPEYPGAIWFD